MNVFAKRQYLKCFTDQTTPKSFNSMTVYRLSLLLRKRDANAIFCQSVGELCSNAAPEPIRDATHMAWVFEFGL